MTQDRTVRAHRSIHAPLLVALTAFCVSCNRDSIAPDQRATQPPQLPSHVAGVVEITFHNIGSPNMTSTAIVGSSVAEVEAIHARQAAAEAGGMRPSLDLTVPTNSSGPADSATIEIKPVTAGSFTESLSPLTTTATRYIEATFRVRNAQRDSTPFDTPRRNLTFVAVSTANTIGDTPVRVLKTHNGSQGDVSLARQLIPTGLVDPNSAGALVVLATDVLQVLTEPELTRITLPSAVTNVFPYGFVVKKVGSTTTRTLNPSPAPEQFDGVVSFAFKIPKQTNPDNDPTTISVMMIGLDDSETRLTQSLQEQYTAATIAALDRALLLGATTVTILPGGAVPGAPGIRSVCSVRTAGTAASATAYMVHVPSSFLSLIPNPYALVGSFIPATTNFQATFSSIVTGASSTTFTVRGIQSGPAFVGQAYSGNGTTTITTPTKKFFASEEIEIAISNALSCPITRVVRFRVASGSGQGNFFPANTNAAHDSTYALAVGDLNNNGKLDIVATNLSTNDVSVFLGNGDGTFGTARNVSVGRRPVGVALGDVNGDGILDLVVANELDRTVSVRRGRGDGTFGDQTTFAVGGARGLVLADVNGNGQLDVVVVNAEGTLSVLLNDGTGAFYPQHVIASSDLGKQTGIAVSDLNRDGAPDLAVTDSTSGRVSVWLGNGNGSFQAEREFAVGTGPSSVGIGDFNGDGIPDLAVSNQTANTVSVLIGNGDGTFQAALPQVVGNRPTSIVVADFDGDGKMDFATANLPDREASVVLGNGNGTFQSRRTFFIGEAPRTIVAGDFNGNTILGLAVANLVKNGTVSVFPGRSR